MRDLSAIAMRSNPYKSALKADLIATLPDSQSGFVQTFRGLAIIVDDGLPKITVVTSVSAKFASAGTSRRRAWPTMRRLLADAGKPDRPGLYVTRGCEYFWSTVPYLARDHKRVEDVDSSGPDHAADAVRYGCLRHRMAMSIAGSEGCQSRLRALRRSAADIRGSRSSDRV